MKIQVIIINLNRFIRELSKGCSALCYALMDAGQGRWERALGRSGLGQENLN